MGVGVTTEITFFLYEAVIMIPQISEWGLVFSFYHRRNNQDNGAKVNHGNFLHKPPF